MITKLHALPITILKFPSLKNAYILIFLLVSGGVFSQSLAVGHTTVAFMDADRNRTIETEIYYPAAIAGDDEAIASGSFPVLVFGHGFLMGYDAYKNFWEALVPEGYIICFPKTEGGILPNHGKFGADLKFVASAMQLENTDSSSLFFNGVASKTALMGHSMGGGASFLGAANNPDIDALVNFAAAETNPSAIAAAANVTVPTLIFSGADDCVTPEASNQDLMYASLTSGCKTQVSINNGKHCFYANSNLNCSLGEGFCNSSSNITRAEQQTITFSFLKLWLSAKLYGDLSSQTNFNSLLESSNQINFKQSCETLHIQDVLTSKSMAIYPNPVDDVLNIRISENNAGGDFKIYNALGQKIVVTKIDHADTSIDLTDLQSGFYFYSYTKERFKISGKFLKTKRN